MYRRILAPLAALLLFLPPVASAQRQESRPLQQGTIYLGTAPGFAFGGKSLPRALYMDAIHGGYVFASGVDVSLALTGMNFFPDPGDYAISMGRVSLGYRPFQRDPLPMIQPYGFLGTGLGGDGRYQCEPEPSCDPDKDSCRTVCGRTRWVGDFFLGAGLDVNTHLLWLGGQQLLLYTGVQARYEWIFGRYQMPVITFPIGLKLL